MDLDDISNIAIPYGPNASTCGYCSPPGQRSKIATNYHTASLEAIKLSCEVYQGMIDRGWRRSGSYCYKPDLKLSCCPQYTIRLDATEFKPSRSQRQLLNRWNRFVLFEDSYVGESANQDTRNGSTSNSKPSKKPPKLAPFTSLTKTIHESEVNFQTSSKPRNKFEVILEPASYTSEKFALYQRYQADIHSDVKNSPNGFKRFLVNSPLQPHPIPYTSPPPDHLPLNYGSYHQLYKLNGQLIGMGVLDILPKCVSSVYFMYDKAMERFSLGKLSALREISLAQEIREAGASEMEYLYMGFYIYSCQKMRYKGDYSPSYLADPETYEWFPLASCIPILQKHRYACFSEASHSVIDKVAKNDTNGNGNDVEATGSDSSDAVDVEMEDQECEQESLDHAWDEGESEQEEDEGFLPSPSESETMPDELDDIKILARSETGNIFAMPIKETGYLSFKQVRVELGACLEGLGEQLVKEISFSL